MNHPKHPRSARGASSDRSDFEELVCSPEFATGCADPQAGAPPRLKPTAPIPAVKPRPDPSKRAEAQLPPAPVKTHNAVEQPKEGFPETACSYEFPEGCVNPSDEERRP